MAGVDRMDQSVNNYRIGYRGKKWWASIFTWFLDVAVNNAWQLQRGSRKLGQLDFKREIAIYYCKHYGTKPILTGPKQPRRESNLTRNIRYDRTDHFVGYTAKRRNCQNTGCKTVGRSECIKCNVGLCFTEYHTPLPE